jgi:peptide deformylase
MALLKIARMGHPVLKLPANPVLDPKSDEIAQLVEDMVETMIDAGGTGLAAPQVHVPLRVVVFTVYPERDEAEGGDGSGVPLTVLINPEIEPLSEEKAFGWEGCLSIPGMMGEVPRFTHIRYKALDLNGKPFEREARGFHARVVQHECDHLDGILYPGRIVDMSTFGFTDEMMRQRDRETDREDDLSE